MTIEQFSRTYTKYIEDLVPFGSQVYGTWNEESDMDWICVVNEYIPEFGDSYKSDLLDIDFFTVKEFNQMFEQYDVRAMEVFFEQNNHLILQIKDKNQFRKSFSTVFNHSWVKGKKKLITSDYEPHLAIKSVFHSLRILDFGIQILQSGKIFSFNRNNYILEDLRQLSEKYSRLMLWEKIESKYLSIFKEKKAIFNGLAPKTTVKSQITQVLQKHSVTPTKQLIKDLNAIL